MARVDLTTAGVKVGWAVETTAGTRPTTYEHFVGINSVPDMNPEPSSRDATTFDELEYKVYAEGLKDLSGATGFGANITQAFIDQWEAMVTACEAANDDGLSMWFAVHVPKLDKAWFFPCKATHLGIPAMSTDSVITGDAYVTLTGEIEMDTAPTFTEYAA